MENVDGQTDVGHINLIGGLVTRNPPKNEQMDRKTRQMNGRIYTNFERNLAMMVMYVPVKFELDWSNHFRVRVRKQKCGRTDGWTEKRTKTKKGRKNGQTNRRNFTNFERNLAMMVIYLPVKFEFDWSNRFKVRVRKRKCGQTDGWTDKRTKNGQTNTRNFTNFERNLAMMVIYLPVKFEFDWSHRFKVRVRKQKCGQTDGWTDKQTKNGQTNTRNFTNFERNLAMMVIYLPVKFEFDWSNRFKVRVRKRKMWTDRRTDGHINLIGGLVTRNPPNKKAIMGSFEHKPFERMHYSPLMARDKPDGGGGVRVIVDLSWPMGSSVNSYIPDNQFDCINFNLKYPTIDMVIEKIKQLGPQALLYKADLERAFRNLRIDPLAYPLCGLTWNDVTYVDVSVAFGLKIGAAACQMCTDVITFKLRQQGAWVMNYLDDYVGVANKEKADSQFQSLLNILQQVGLPVNEKKLEPPSSVITCLGIEIDAKNGKITIPNNKLQEIQQICKIWSTKKMATKKQLQSLIGKLLYIHKCVHPARSFVNRMLAVLRNAPVSGFFVLPGMFYKDIAWFNKFLADFNGIVKIHNNEVQKQNVFVDASLQQVGGIWRKQVYCCNIPDRIKNLVSIVQLEAANIMLAARVWGKCWTNQEVMIWCDNLAVVHAYQSQRIKDHWLMACCRTLWYIAAKYNIKFHFQHIYGIDNVNADILSRWSVYKNSNTSRVQNLKKCNWVQVDNEMLWPDLHI